MTDRVGSVMTVLGPVPPDRLGYTLMHEHTEISLWEIEGRYDYGGQFNAPDVLAAELGRFRDAGGSAIVDLTLPAIGRDASRIRRLAKATGLHIVMGCGWYRQPYYPPEDLIGRSTVDELAARLIGEILGGVPDADGGERIRPGILGELGADNPWLSPAEERVHRASARAALATGLAISTHSIGGCGPAQLDVLAEEGVHLSRVVVGHADDAPDRGYAREIVTRGAAIAFDRVGNLEPYLTERSADLVVELTADGFGSQLFVSQDVCMRRQLACMGGNGFTYAQTEFELMLRDRGFSDEDIHRLFVDNPARLLTIHEPSDRSLRTPP